MNRLTDKAEARKAFILEKAKLAFDAYQGKVLQDFYEMNKGIDIKKIIPVPTWDKYPNHHATYIAVAEAMFPESSFPDKGPWKYGCDTNREGHKKHFVESQGPSGEDFDDMRLYLNGNMTEEMYVKYGKQLAEHLNSTLK